MEIMCDYFDNGYQLLYNLDDPDIKNGEQIVKFVQNEILNCGYKVLIVVDDAHTKRSATIFYVIDNHQPKTIKFLLTARIPEFYNSFLEEENLSEMIQVQETRKAIRKIAQNNHFRYELPPFEPDEVKGFILKYEQEASSREKESIENEAHRLHEETRGNPIMVKFFVIGHGQGLEQDVNERHSRYLKDPNNMQTMLVCSLLDIANLQINYAVLENMGLKRYADKLHGDLLHRTDIHKTWKTIHPRWDLELFYLLYSKIDDEYTIEKRKEYLKEAIRRIFDLGDEKITTSIIVAAYSLTYQELEGYTKPIIPLEIIEDVVESKLPDYLSNPTKLLMHAAIKAPAYYRNGRYQDAINICDQVLEIDNGYLPAWSNKGVTLIEVGKSDKAIVCFDKAIELEPSNLFAWYNKGYVLSALGNNTEAIECYNKAIEIDANYAKAWSGKATSLSALGNNTEAIEFYNKAIEIDPGNAQTWYDMGLSFMSLGYYNYAN
jgi:tetratricopeptide (TPR) repeat protein